MSHFYSTIEGNARTPANRYGTKNSGIQGHIRGWDIGGLVRLDHSQVKGVDILYFTLTGGSNSPMSKGLFVKAWLDKNGEIQTTIHNTIAGETDVKEKNEDE